MYRNNDVVQLSPYSKYTQFPEGQIKIGRASRVSVARDPWFDCWDGVVDNAYRIYDILPYN